MKVMQKDERGKFMKGMIPWNKGKKGSQVAWNKGLKMPEQSGANHPQWKGGKYKHSQGYIFVYSPDHPNKSKDGYVFEHRLVMEKKLGRFLGAKEQVHHKNHNNSDNKISNLVLCNQKKHSRLHSPNYKLEDNKWYKFCKHCQRFLRVNSKNFYITNGCVSVSCRHHHGKSHERGVLP